MGATDFEQTPRYRRQLSKFNFLRHYNMYHLAEVLWLWNLISAALRSMQTSIYFN